MNEDFWRGRRVFVTGHTGFKGAWLSLWLQKLGAEVTGYALAPPTDPSAFDLARVGEGMTSVEGDVRDLDGLTRAMAAARPEVVLHLAAQAIVLQSYDDPVTTYEVNVMGTLKVLEAARATGGVGAIVNVTSDKCYENREWLWAYREIEPMGGKDPYSSSKGCSEIVTASYRESYGVPLASARAGNVIGGGDWAADRLVPDLMRGAVAGQSARIRNPMAVRPWQHVLNPLWGYLLLAERLHGDQRYAEAWNLGPDDDDARTVGWIGERIESLWGDGLDLRIDEPDPGARPEARFLKVDSSKAKAELGWAPAWHLGDALEQTVEWYRAYAAGADMRQVTTGQIAAYEAAAGATGGSS